MMLAASISRTHARFLDCALMLTPTHLTALLVLPQSGHFIISIYLSHSGALIVLCSHSHTHPLDSTVGAAAERA